MHYNFLKVLEEANILENIKRICGASAGSIMALLFAVGYSTKEMKEIMFNSNLTKKSTGLLLRPRVVGQWETWRKIKGKLKKKIKSKNL